MINFPITAEYVASKTAAYEIASGENPTSSAKLRGIAKAIQQLIAWLELDEQTPIAISYLNNYADFDLTYTPATYYKDRFKRVFLDGVIKRNSGSSSIIANLPAGYRPAKTIVFSVNVYDGSTYQPRDLRILVTGEVNINLPPASIAFCPLSGLSFRVA